MKSICLAHPVSSSAYDQRLGQFLSADPFVQDPTNTQSYNRYAYCLNNPLKYTDPSGYRASNGNNNYWGQDGDQYSNVNYYIDGVSVSSTEFRAYGGAGTTEFHGNINWSGPGGGYCMVDFNYHQDASTITINYKYKRFNNKGTDNSIVANLPEEVCSADRLWHYGSYTFQKPMGRQLTSSANESLSSNGNETVGFIIGGSSLCYDSFQNVVYNGYQYIPTKGANKGILTSVWKMTKNGDFALKNGSKVANSANALSKIKLTNAVKIFGVGLNVIGLGITSVDMYQNGLNISNGSDFVFGCIAFIPPYGWAVSGSYFIGKEFYNSTTTTNYLIEYNIPLGNQILFK